MGHWHLSVGSRVASCAELQDNRSVLDHRLERSYVDHAHTDVSNVERLAEGTPNRGPLRYQVTASGTWT